MPEQNDINKTKKEYKIEKKKLDKKEEQKQKTSKIWKNVKKF